MILNPVFHAAISGVGDFPIPFEFEIGEEFFCEEVLDNPGMRHRFEAAILDDEGIAGRRFLRRVFPIRVTLAIEQQLPAGGLLGGRKLVVGGESEGRRATEAGDQKQFNRSHRH